MRLMWNGMGHSIQEVHAVERNFLRGACGVTIYDGEYNESMYERCGMEMCANGVKCSVKMSEN